MKNNIECLRKAYDKIDRIDPEGEFYNKLINFLDNLPQEHLIILEKANVKFVSALARNRIKNN